MYTIPAGTPLTKEIISGAIERNEKMRAHYTLLYRYYEGDHDILRREKVESLSNRKTVTNHAKYITNINVGYFLGSPVDYSYTGDIKDIEVVIRQFKKQSIKKTDNEIAKSASKMGRSYDYTYALENNDVHTKKIDPRNACIIYDNTLEHKKLYGITYTCVEGGTSDGKNKKYIGVSVADDKFIYKYDESLNEILSEKKSHAFGAVPLVEYPNNDEYLGDYEDVISLIDAYNILQSDRINDKEQLVEAILAFTGASLTEEIKRDLKIFRVITLPKEADAKYIIKQLDEVNIDVLRKAIKEDIHTISQTPNFSDENFLGNASGVALKYKLLAFELNAQNKELFFESSLMERFGLYVNYFSTLKQMPRVDLSEITPVFTRTLPQNDFETSQTINNLDSIVSRKTLIRQLSFVENADEEIQQASKESMEKVSGIAKQFGTNQPSRNANNQDGDQE